MRPGNRRLLTPAIFAVVLLLLGCGVVACGADSTTVRVGARAKGTTSTSIRVGAGASDTTSTIPIAALPPSGVLSPTSTTTQVPAESPTTAAPNESTTIASSTEVLVRSPTKADLIGLSSAFDSWESMQPTCGGQPIAGSVKIATIRASGISWATADFEPVPSCIDYVSPSAGPSSQTIPPDQVPPFEAVPGPPLGVFEQLPGSSWTMNEEGGTEFPCPAPRGAAPGPGNGSIPTPVLAAWHLSYAADCSNVAYPQQPGS
jgi:hypothetical protein